jgi:hypothetical protein
MYIKIKFQFHKGTINTNDYRNPNEIVSRMKFQFHKGTINTKTSDIVFSI